MPPAVIEIYAIRLLHGDYTYATKPVRHPRACSYTTEDAAALEHLSDLLDWLCSKSMTATIPLVLARWRDDGTLDIRDTCARRRPTPKHRRGFTKPGTLLTYRIPLRTSAERQAPVPGYLDVDLVDQSSGNASGTFWFTLAMADALSQWMEPRAVLTKAQQGVFDEMQCGCLDLPFPVLGIHSDSGSEFINDQLYRYCRAEYLKFTRGRAGKKNDNARVEQKNGSVVRYLAGYGRSETQAQADQLKAVSARVRWCVNFFNPVVKRQAKRRVGSKVKRIYDNPQTPYQRLIECATLDPAATEKLKATYTSLRWSKVKADLDWRLAVLKPRRTFTATQSDSLVNELISPTFLMSQFE